MKYFENTLHTAERNYYDYSNKTNAQRSHIAFGAAGNLSKASYNRFKTIRDVSHDKYLKLSIRKVMLEIYNTTFYEPFIHPVTKKVWTSVKIIHWGKFNDIISKCKEASVYCDTYDYFHAEIDNGLNDKVNAIRHFINKYGSKTDKRILIPKIQQ